MFAYSNKQGDYLMVWFFAFLSLLVGCFGSQWFGQHFGLLLSMCILTAGIMQLLTDLRYILLKYQNSSHDSHVDLPSETSSNCFTQLKNRKSRLKWCAIIIGTLIIYTFLFQIAFLLITHFRSIFSMFVASLVPLDGMYLFSYTLALVLGLTVVGCTLYIHFFHK